jgi:CelD/BcsL family acetyltransferase involved in cellulose biosynthesis
VGAGAAGTAIARDDTVSEAARPNHDPERDEEPALPNVSISIEHELDDLRESWTGLAATGNNVFATWEWAATWWRHLGHGTPLVAVVYIDSDLRGIIPLYAWRTRPLRILRFIGHGPADELAPICAPADEAAVAASFPTVLARLRPYDVFLGDVMPASLPWSQERTRLVVEGSPSIEIEQDTWQAYLASQSRNFRDQMRRRDQKLRNAGEAQFRATTTRETLSEDLDCLFRLHRERWGRRTGFSELEPFHREFAALAFDRGWLRLWILALDDHPVAAWYGFRYGNTYACYQQGREPGRGDISVGTVLLTHTIREAVNEGARVYAFLRGNEPYKYRFANRDDVLETIGIAGSLRGGAALRSYRGATAAAGWLRRRLRRHPR